MGSSKITLSQSFDQQCRDWDTEVGRYLARGSGTTPVYLYDPHLLVKNLESATDAFDTFRLLVSVKANPHPGLLRLLVEHSANLDLASLSEIEVAAAEGADLSRCSFVGPAKSQAALELAVKSNLGSIVIESPHQLRDLARIATTRTIRSRIVLRVNPAVETAEANEVMGGVASQFGVDEESTDEVFNFAVSNHVPIEGLHFFLGSQLRDLHDHARNLEAIKAAVVRLAPRFSGTASVVVDFGGGFGVTHEASHPAVDIHEVAQEYKAAVKELEASVPFAIDPEIETGRYIYGTAGVFLSRIVEVKKSRGVTFAILESGISGFGRPAFRWGESHPVWIAGQYGEDRGIPVRVVGPTCLPGDMIASDTNMAAPAVGDIVVVGVAGAYGYSMSPLNWGSIARPEEVLL